MEARQGFVEMKGDAEGHGKLPPSVSVRINPATEDPRNHVRVREMHRPTASVRAQGSPVVALAADVLSVAAKHGRSTAFATTHMRNENVSDRDVGVRGCLSVRHRNNALTAQT